MKSSQSLLLYSYSVRNKHCGQIYHSIYYGVGEKEREREEREGGQEKERKITPKRKPFADINLGPHYEYVYNASRAYRY